MTESVAVGTVLEDARRLGFLGPDPVELHLRHAEAWASALQPANFLDLGSGGGLPGLVIASLWPDTSGVLLDGQRRRTAWLRSAVARLGVHQRVRVVEGRAEEFGHDPEFRERFALVVARSFGPPATTAECGSAFLRVGGTLSVSEPPSSGPERWPDAGIAELGLADRRQVVREGLTFVILRKTAALAGTFPRRRNLASKAPLW